MVIPMLELGEMHKITLAFVIIELMLLTYQLHYYYSRPADKSRLWHLFLLCLLVLYNITNGFFPDPKIKWISVKVQNILAYGTGFAIGSYFPFYFYKNFKLTELQFEVIYGVPLFFLLPFALFFVVIYSTIGTLEFAITYGLIVPFFYSLYLLWVLFKAIRVRLKTINDFPHLEGKFKIVGAYCAIFPWVSLCAFAYFDINQWIEVLVSNFGIVLLTIMFMFQSVAKARVEHERLMTILVARGDEFQKYCLKFGLTMQQERVAELLCKGFSYQEIANTLFVSKKTVDTHIQHIFLKTGVNRKFQLMQKFGLADVDHTL